MNLELLCADKPRHDVVAVSLSRQTGCWLSDDGCMCWTGVLMVDWLQGSRVLEN